MDNFAMIGSGLLDEMGLEKMNLAQFRNSYVVRRPTQAPGKYDIWSQLKLPTNAVLHTAQGFDTLTPVTGGLPDPMLPPVMNEKLAVFLKIHAQLAHDASVPFGVSEPVSYRPNKMMAAISHFYQQHRRYHRILSDRTLSTMSGVLTWVDYSPLMEVQTMGTLHAYRKFDVIFRTILDMICQIGADKQHFIVLPQGHSVYGRSVLKRAYSDLSTNTLSGFHEDPSIFPILHLLGYVFGKTNTLDVKPYKEDIRILGKDKAVIEGAKSSSLLERIPESLHASIYFVLQREDRAVIYNLADLDTFAQSPAFYPKFYRHIMNLRLSEQQVPDHIDTDSDQFDTVVQTYSRHPDEEVSGSVEPVEDHDTPEQDVITATPITVPVTSVVRDPKVNAPIALHPTQKEQSYEDRVREAAGHHSASDIVVDPKKASRHATLLDQHLNTVVAGKSLGEWIQKPLPQTITPKVMDFVTSAPEDSYKTSSLLAMDKSYQHHAYHHELAKVLTSLGKHGLFINKVEESHTHSEMDKLSTYKVHLSDLSGKSHHVKFTLPGVDNDGLMTLSGTEYRLNRQMANIPICKTSPTRVNLSSYYNKIIVERVVSKRFSYEHEMVKKILALKAQGLLDITAGSAPYPTEQVPFDFTALGRRFSMIMVKGYHWQFGQHHASMESLDIKVQDKLLALQKTMGVYAGRGPKDSYLFFDQHNQLHVVADDLKTQIASWSSFGAMLVDLIGEAAVSDKPVVEWVQARILNQTIPLIFILAYKMGLKAVLDAIKLDYRFVPSRAPLALATDDIAIPMDNGTLVFNRYPVEKSLLVSGLAWTNLKTYRFEDLSIPSTYGSILAQKKMSVGVLKGLNGFFDFFVDPITETVLEKMGEPITFAALLLRATVMLSDYQADPSSSVKLHRFRLYERFNGMVYNSIYRQLANHRNNPSTRKGFSINPEEVFQKIVQDATVSPNDVINPVHEVKQRASFTYTGAGGRNGNSFVLRDRIYPEDGVGVISDAVPDSGKVGITSYLTASPRIDDIHGLPKAYTGTEALAPPQILSIGSMVMPGGTTDDGKRNSYLSIQISHYVPNHENGETLAVRTGYDAVLPHLSSDTFATAATDTGVVTGLDIDRQVLTVQYADTPMVVSRSLKLPYLDTLIDRSRQDEKPLGYLIPADQIGSYPTGGIFSLTRSSNGKILDRLRCETMEAIPDKESARKQNALVQDLVRGKIDALYYLHIQPIAKTHPGETMRYSYKNIYSPISGAYLLQTRIPKVKVGDAVKRGDILVYNPGFFVPDPLSQQVTFKHGVIATVALIDKSSNLEDASEISPQLAERLKMTPCHQREIVTRPDAAILAMVKMGQHVETSDPLCIIADEYLVGSMVLDLENLGLMEKLNRQTPSASYTGTIVKMRILYGCDRADLSESLKAILKVYEKEVRQDAAALQGSAHVPERPGYVEPGTKYKSIDFNKDVVVLEFMIQETLGMSEGDKLVLGNAAKNIVSHVSEKSHFTESGLPIDMLFSTTSISNRIISSPFLGMAERVMEETKRQVLKSYFG